MKRQFQAPFGRGANTNILSITPGKFNGILGGHPKSITGTGVSLRAKNSQKRDLVRLVGRRKQTNSQSLGLWQTDDLVYHSFATLIKFIFS